MSLLAIRLFDHAPQNGFLGACCNVHRARVTSGRENEIRKVAAQFLATARSSSMRRPEGFVQGMSVFVSTARIVFVSPSTMSATFAPSLPSNTVSGPVRAT